MAQQTVRNVMNGDPVSVTTRTPFKDVVGLMMATDVSAVPVLGRHGELVGVVTETDLLVKQGLQPDPGQPRPVRRAYRARWAHATGACAGEVMTVRPVTVRPEATVSEAARLMVRHGCPFLPVVDQLGKLAGTVESRDLLRVFLRPDGEIREEVARELQAGGFAASPDDLTVDVDDGVVTVTGQVRGKSMLPLALATIRAVGGVVDVEGQLRYAIDDTRVPAQPGSAPRA